MGALRTTSRDEGGGHAGGVPVPEVTLGGGPWFCGTRDRYYVLEQSDPFTLPSPAELGYFQSTGLLLWYESTFAICSRREGNDLRACRVRNGRAVVVCLELWMEINSPCVVGSRPEASSVVSGVITNSKT